jgi:hypothetical protein
VGDDEVENNFSSFWGWYQALSVLSDDKVWQIDIVSNLPLITCLNHLSYLMDLNKQKEEAIKKQQQQYK